MTIVGCRAEVQKVMDVSVSDIDTIERALQRHLDAGVPRKKAQVMAVEDALRELRGERQAFEAVVADQLLPQVWRDMQAEQAAGQDGSDSPVKVPNAVRYSKREYDAIVQEHKGKPTWMKAPNGQPTKLTERQWVQVRTPQFKAFFGDWEKHANADKPASSLWSDDTVSKVVDEDTREPKVVFHGTSNGGFMAFRQPGGQRRGDIGVFTTDDYDMARSYVRKGRAKDITPPDMKTLAEEAGVEFFEYQGRTSSKDTEDRTLYGYTTPYGDEVDGFTSMEDAVADAGAEYADESSLEDQPGIYALFVNLRNPYEADFEGALWNGSRDHQWVVEYAGEIQPDSEGKQYFDSQEEALDFAEIFRPGDDEGEFDPADYVRPADEHYETTDDVAREGVKSGDGAIIHNVVDDGGGPGNYMMTPATVYVLRDPEQVKSADWNNGDFSAKKADLRYSSRTKQEKPAAKSTQDPAVGDKTDVSKLQAGRTIPPEVAVGGLESAFALARGKTYAKGRDLKLDLQDAVLQAAKAARVSLTTRTKALHQFLSDMVFKDAMYALKTNESAIGWYDQKVSRAIGAISVIHPEINTSKESRLAFLWALAVTSNGLKVDKNFELAESAYRRWKESHPDVVQRKMPTDVGIGNAAKGINDGLSMFNDLVAGLGHERAAKFMATEFPAGDITRMLGLDVGGEWKGTPVRGAAILGPKIGNGFYMNLNGYFDALTMDRWLMRTFGRMTGTLLNIDKAAIDGARAKLKSAIAAMTQDQRKAMADLIGMPVRKDLKLSELDSVAAALDKASMKPEKRKAMQSSAATNRFRLDARGLAKALDGQKEAPSGPAERNWIRAIFATALERLRAEGKGMTMSDLQALLWYPERRLYDAAKADDTIEEGYEDDDAPDYANAAMKLALDNGADRDAVIKAMDEAEARGTVRAETLTEAERNAMLREMRAAPVQPTQMAFEVAPDPADAQAVAAWSVLSAKERAAITQDVREAVMDGIYGATGLELKKVVGATGGFAGLINPNLIGEYQTTKVSYEQARQLASAIGYVLDQDSVALADPRSGQTVDMIRLTFNEKPDAYVEQIFQAIRGAVPELDAFTLRGNNFDVLNFTGLPGGYIVDKIKGAIDQLDVPLEYVGSHGKIKSELVEKDSYEGHLEGIRSRNREGVRELAGLRDIARQAVAAGIAARGGDAVRAGRAGAAGLAQQPAAPADGVIRRSERDRGFGGAGRQEADDGSRGSELPDRGASQGAESRAAVGQQDSGAGRPGRAQGPGVGRGAGAQGGQESGLTPLPGAPTVDPVKAGTSAGPDARLVAVAEQYARDNGIDLRRQSEYVQVDPERAKRIADAYEAMPHAPQDPKVKEAFENLIRQTTAQYRALEQAGYKFWLFGNDNDPYAGNPWAAMADLRENQSMAVYSTAAGFGANADFDPTNNPLLADTGIRWPYGSPDGELQPVYANDLFRAVHDAFGHGLEGSGFRARGEENAWQAHIRMFTGSAKGAITSETRGQNSWLNYGPQGEANQTASVFDTAFADQKTGLMPEWTWTEGLAGDMPKFSRRNPQGETRISYSNRDPLGYYSALTRGIEGMQTKAAPAGAWKAQIKGLLNKGAIKAEELEWTGLEDWLDLQEGKIAKDQILAYLQANGVKVEEVVLESGQKGEQLYEPDYPYLVMQDGEIVDRFTSEWRAQEFARENGGEVVEDFGDGAIGEDKTKYGQYTLPGGENYREILLTLPTTAQPFMSYDQWWKERTAAGKKASAAEYGKARAAHEAAQSASYKSSHWDQPNVLAHIRVNDRVDADGGRVLFVEELQSDFGQDIKKKGMAQKVMTEAQRAAKLADAKSLTAAIRQRADADRAAGLEQISDETLELNNADSLRVSEIMRELENDKAAALANTSKLPRAPFVGKTEGWLNLALKRVITLAVDGGYDKVAFVNGQQSADRYDLSQQVSVIQYRKNDDGTFKASALFRRQENHNFGDNLTANQLEDYVGKEVAQKMIAGEGEPVGSGPYRQLSGGDLKVGGEGMKAFYDKIVPNAVKALLKKVGGGQLESVNIGSMDTDQGAADDALLAGLGVEVRGTRPDGQPGFSITPAMREKVSGGQPLFSRRGPVAEAAGFDSSVTYYHGTTAKDFKAFKPGKGGVDELGPGIYFTSDPMYAEAWAGRPGMGGRIIPAYLKKGDLFDKSKPVDYVALARRIKANNPVTEVEVQAAKIRASKSVTEWTPEESRIVNDASMEPWRSWLLESDQALANNIRRGELNTWLDRAGYIGAINPNSQIPGQAVVFRPENIRSPWAKFNTKKAGSGNLLYSRRDPGDAWMEYANKVDAFKFGRDELMQSKSISDLARAFSTPGLRITQDKVAMEGEGVQIIVGGDKRKGRMALVYTPSTGNYVVDAGEANPAYDFKAKDNQGQRMYQTLFAYAHNNGLVVDADFSLSYPNELRRTSAMLSSALRFGSTDHFGRINDEQGINGWDGADFKGRVSAMAMAEAAKVAQRIPQFDNLTINPETGAVYSDSERVLDQPGGRGDSGQPVDSGSGAGQPRGVGSQDRAGAATGVPRADGRGTQDARLRDRAAQGDARERAGDAGPLGSAAAVQGQAVADSELARYLASVGGGFDAHGVGVATLKRALITRQVLGGDGADIGQGGLLYSMRVRQENSENFLEWSDYAPLVRSDAAESYDFKTGQKVVLEAFHGTGRGDRVGEVFQKKRATSGPMAYFTSNPALASSYATGKADTSRGLEENPYESWFKYQPKGQRTPVDIGRAWYSLDAETKARIAERMPDIRMDDDGNPIYEAGGGDIGSYDYNLKQTQRSYDKRGNPLQAAVETWLNSGTLFGDEQSFMKVLQLAGFPVKDVTFDNPSETFPFVYKTYVKMGSPLVTNDVPKEVKQALRLAAAKDRSKARYSQGVDPWDKNTRTVKDWVDAYLNPQGDSDKYVWTSIPDKVTAVFKELGYDGIIDWSGKGGGTVHPVYIPFEETQVKSAIGNNGDFSNSKRNIMRSARNPQEGTAEFKRWFGDSKVVDAEGKPLVVYHGTVVRPDTEAVKGMGDIAAFDRLFTTQFRRPSVDTMGSWFSTNPGTGGAEMYSGSYPGSVIYPVYLSIQNPQETTFHLLQRRARLLATGKDDGRVLGEAEVNAYRKWLADIGKDGIKIVHDEGADNGSTEFKSQDAWIALHPNQIKSAIGNNGNFDPANPDIRRSARDAVETIREYAKKNEDTFFRTPKSDAKGLEQIASDIMGDTYDMRRIFDASGLDPRASKVWGIEFEWDGEFGRTAGTAYISEKNDAVWVNVGSLSSRVGGGVVHMIAGAYAHNNGKVFIGDPDGITSAGKNRRLEHMISLALKYGTTKFMRPHDDMIGWRGLMWGNNDDHNLQFLLRASYTNSVYYHPEIKEFSYDPATGQFTRNGQRVGKADFESLAAARYGASPQSDGSGAPGSGTLRLAVLYQSAQLQSDPEARARWRDWIDSSSVEVGPDAPLGGVRYSRRNGTSQWDEPAPSGWDNLVHKFQDKLIDLKRVQQDITKWTGAIADDINVYLQEELFHGRAAKRTQDFVQTELNPLLEQMRRDGLELVDLEEFLLARHAPEANALIAQRNPGVANLQDGGSGMKTADAQAYMQSLSQDKRAKLEAAAKVVDAIQADTNRLLVDYGLVAQAQVDSWGQMFQYYVPLHREDEGGGMGLGQGYSIKGKEVKSRTGSTRKVVDIVANIAMQRERTITRGEKNRVANALVGLVATHPNPDFWTVGQAPTERVYDAATGLAVDRPIPNFKQRDNVVTAKVKGANGEVQEVAVVFNEDNERALRLARSMKNLDAGSLEGLLGVSAKISRYFAAINTQYNPVFGIVNLVRDLQGAMVNLGTTPLANQKGRISRDAVRALVAVYQDERARRKGKPATSAWSNLWEEFQDVGGQTGFRDLFKNSADRTQAIENTLDPQAWMKTTLGRFVTLDGRMKMPADLIKRGLSPVFDWLTDYNQAMENGVRLAAYKAGLDQGMSKAQAASLAKNLTVNFNRKGQIGQQMGAVYAFFNAAMQGTARMGESLMEMERPGDPKSLRLTKFGKKVVYGGMLLGSLQALALAASGFDDDEPPEFVRERSVIIPIGDKKYLTVPMPLGLHVIPGLGRHMTEFAMSGFDKPAERITSIIGMFADSFNPIGNAGLSMQTIAPTALDPLIALTENRDFAGRPIAKQSYDKTTPGHALARDTATAPAKWLSEAINTLSGGSKYVSGVLSPTPDQIDYLAGQVGGGVWRELSKIEQTGKSLYQGEEMPSYKVPLLGRFYGDSRSQAGEGNLYYSNQDRINRLEAEIKGLEKDGKRAEAQALRRQPDAYLIAQSNVAERQLRKLRAEKRALVEQGAPREKVRAVEERITQVMARLNRAVEARQAR